jgi:hypothetical protein
MDSARKEYIATIASRVSDLYEELRARNIRDQKDLWFLHADSQDHQADPASQQFAMILADIKRLNPSNLSERLIISQIAYNSLAIALWKPRYGENIVEDAQERIEGLATYSATRNVDIPILNLDTRGIPFHIGPVHFFPITDSDRDDKWWERVSAYVPYSVDFHVVSYARVQSGGDSETAWAHAIEATEKALVLLRGIGFPFSTKQLPQIGIVSEHPISPGRPLRLGKPIENVRIEGYSNNVTLLGPPTSPYGLQQDLLNEITPSSLTELIKFIDDNFFQTTSDLNSKFISGLFWLGRATFPDTPEASLVKIAISLESFIGGEPNIDYLASRGLTATLAERAAFIAGTNLTTRTKIHKTITDLYKIRSNIVHGREIEVKDGDLQKYGTFVRSIAWELLPRLSTITTIDHLQRWVRDARYKYGRRK